MFHYIPDYDAPAYPQNFPKSMLKDKNKSCNFPCTTLRNFIIMDFDFFRASLWQCKYV